MRCRKSPYSTVSHRPYYDDEPTILDPLKSLTGTGRSPTIRASGLAAHGVIASAAKPRDQAKRRDETDVPAERRQAEALPRLSLADGHPQRPQGAEGATRQGAQAAGGVGEVEVPDGSECRPEAGRSLPDAAAVPPTHPSPTSVPAKKPQSHRFGRVRRILRRRDFDAVFARPSARATVPPLWAVAAPSQADSARLGLVVAKKVLRRAVDRNRAKRAIRESFRLNQRLPAVDIVVRVVEPGPVTVADADRLFGVLQRRLAHARRR